MSLPAWSATEGVKSGKCHFKGEKRSHGNLTSGQWLGGGGIVGGEGWISGGRVGITGVGGRGGGGIVGGGGFMGVKMVEWEALLLGLLPAGGCFWGSPWQLLKNLLALTCALLSPTLNIIFLVYYCYMAQDIMTRFTTLVGVINCASLYITKVLGILLVLATWVDGPQLRALFTSLENLSEKGDRPNMLQYLVWMFFVVLETILSWGLHVFWGIVYVRITKNMNIINLASIIYTTVAMPLLYTFSLVLYVNAGHVILASFRSTNIALEHLLSPSRGAGEEPQPCLLQSLRCLRQRYSSLHRLHRDMSSVLSVSLVIMSLHKLMMEVILLVYILTYTSYITSPLEFWTTMASFVSPFVVFYVQGSVADSLKTEGAAPLKLLAEASTHEQWNVQPEVEAEMLRLVKLSERPLTTKPAGLFTVARSNLLPMATAVTTYMVVFLQFHFDEQSRNSSNVTNSTIQ